MNEEIQQIFSDHGDTILRLGRELAAKIPPKKSSQLRKFLVELRSIKQYDPFELNRFRWNCEYIAAREGSLKEVGKYLEAAAKEVHGGKAAERLECLKAFAQAIYAHYCFVKGSDNE